MNSPPEPGSPSPTTPSSGSPPPDEPQLLPTENTQEPDASPSVDPRSKRTLRTGVLRKLMSRKKEDTLVPTGGNGKQERRGPMSTTLSWVEGTQRAMKEELVNQIVVDKLKRSEWSLPLLVLAADEEDSAL